MRTEAVARNVPGQWAVVVHMFKYTRLGIQELYIWCYKHVWMRGEVMVWGGGCPYPSSLVGSISLLPRTVAEQVVHACFHIMSHVVDLRSHLQSPS